MEDLVDFRFHFSTVTSFDPNDGVAQNCSTRIENNVKRVETSLAPTICTATHLSRGTKSKIITLPRLPNPRRMEASFTFHLNHSRNPFVVNTKQALGVT